MIDPRIEVRVEGKRGCGYRKAGGIYLISDEPVRGCGKLPIPLRVCPCCGHGFKPSRAPVWLATPENLWWDIPCQRHYDECRKCPLSRHYETGPALLIWVGKKFYPTPEKFMRESRYMGISRRIQHVPSGFVVGETWVLLAHQHGIDEAAITDPAPVWVPAIFSVFRPTRLEIVVTGFESEEVIDGYIKRGLTPVLIQRRSQRETHYTQDN